MTKQIVSIAAILLLMASHAEAQLALPRRQVVDWGSVTSKPSVTVGDPEYATLAVAVAKLNTAGAKRQLIIPPTYSTTLTAHLTLNDNIELLPLPGSNITLGTYDLTVNKLSPATGLYQWVTKNSTGNLVLGSGATDRAYPEWWGITGTGDQTAINLALAAAWGRFPVIQSQDYVINGSIDITTHGGHLMCPAWSQYHITAAAGCTTMLTIAKNRYHWKLSNLDLKGEAIATNGIVVSDNSVSGSNCGWGTFDNVTIRNTTGDGLLGYGMINCIGRLEINDCGAIAYHTYKGSNANNLNITGLRNVQDMELDQSRLNYFQVDFEDQTTTQTRSIRITNDSYKNIITGDIESTNAAANPTILIDNASHDNEIQKIKMDGLAGGTLGSRRYVEIGASGDASTSDRNRVNECTFSNATGGHVHLVKAQDTRIANCWNTQSDAEITVLSEPTSNGGRFALAGCYETLLDGATVITGGGLSDSTGWPTGTPATTHRWLGHTASSYNDQNTGDPINLAAGGSGNAFATDWAARANYALTLNGSGYAVAAANHADLDNIGATFSIIAIFTTGADVTTEQTICGKWAATGNHRSWVMVVKNSTVYIRTSADGTAFTESNASAVAAAKTYLVIATLDGAGNAIVTCNGVDTAAMPAMSTPGNDTTDKFCIGSRSASDSFSNKFTGTIHEVGIIKGTALSTAQKNALLTSWVPNIAKTVWSRFYAATPGTVTKVIQGGAPITVAPGTYGAETSGQYSYSAFVLRYFPTNFDLVGNPGGWRQ